MLREGVFILSCLLIFGCQDTISESNIGLGKQYTPDDALIYDEELELEPPRIAIPPPPPMVEEVSEEGYAYGKGSKIVKSGRMKFKVHELDSVKGRVDSILKIYHGYYENEQFNTNGNSNSFVLKIRIPNVYFDSIILLFENGIGKLESKYLRTIDVTEEFVDLNIRLDNKLAYLNQYKQILQKAKSVKDILEIQEKIRRIEEEIDSNNGRLKYLNDKVKYSTLDLEISNRVSSKVASKPSFASRITSAFYNGFQGFFNIIIKLVGVWPFVLFMILLFLVRRPLVRRVRGETQNK